MKTIRIYHLALLTSLLASGLLAGCTTTSSVKAKSNRLDLLTADMTLEKVVELLGQPTSRTSVKPDRWSPPFHELTYETFEGADQNVILRFEPGLAEIRIDTKLYRNFRPY